MEIRLVEKNLETKRYRNVEIYSADDFEQLIYDNVQEALNEMTFWQKFGNFDKVIKNVNKKIFAEFRQRLRENLN